MERRLKKAAFAFDVVLIILGLACEVLILHVLANAGTGMMLTNYHPSWAGVTALAIVGFVATCGTIAIVYWMRDLVHSMGIFDA